MLDLQELLARAERIASDVARPLAERTDREARWPEEPLRALLAEGLGGLVVPVEASGAGQGLFAVAKVCEVLGRACPSTSLCFGMHLVACAVLAAKATPDHRERYLEPIVRGRHLTTLALSEPGTGAHFYLPETRLERTPGGDFRLFGKKSFVTNGGHADSYVVSTAPADPDARPGDFSCFVVPHDAAGLSFGPPWDGLGMRGNSSRTLELQGVLVPRGDLLGAEGDELWFVFRVIAPYFLMAMSGAYLGLAQAALDEVLAHLGARIHAHAGTALGEREVLQHRLGELWAHVERTRAFVHAAARKADTGADDALVAILASKADVAECVVRVANEAMTLAGGIAYGRNARLARILRDARAAHVMAPTTDILRTWTGRALLGLPLLTA